MKKVLSMALALMMVLTLFAVPAMAATRTVENIPLGDMESFADGTDLTATADATQHGAASATANHADSKYVVKDGDIALQLASTSQQAELRTTTVTRKAGTAYVLSFDVYTVAEMNTAKMVQVSYGNNSATDINLGASTTEGITLTKGGAASYINNVPHGEWAHIEFQFTPIADSTGYVSIYFNSKEATNTIMGYIDNVSLTHEEPAVAVTKTVTGNGTMTGVDDLAGVGETKTLTLTPTSTSYLKALTVNGTDVTANATKTWDKTINNYVSTYDVTLNADTAIAAEFADYTMVTKVDEDMENIDYEITGTGSETTWCKSSTGAVELTTDPVYGNVLKVTAGEARTPSHTVELGIYKVSFDAKADTAGTMKLQNSAAYSASVSKWDGKGGGAGWPTITTSWAHYELYFEPTGYSSGDATSNRTLAFGIGTAAGLYIDNVNIVYYSTAAAPAPEVYNVTITGENAVTRLGAATSEGEEVIFIAKPKFGYYIESITIGGTPFNGFDAYKGGTYSTGEIAADTEIVVTVAELAANTEEGVATEVATLPAVFAPAADTAVTFGKVLDSSNATSWGIELTKDGVGVTPYHGGSYLYKALATNANGQYAIEFVGLEAGEYQIRTYMYVNGTPVFGAPTTFVVD